MIEILQKPRVRGRLFENFGLGVLINGFYGISDGSFEIFNLADIIVGLWIMLIGLALQEKGEKNG